MKKTLLAFMAMASLCGYAQTPVEGFEEPWVSPGPNLPAAPPGWIVGHEFGIFTWNQSQPGNQTEPPFGGGNHTAFLQKENVAPSAPIPRNWLMSPIINPQASSEIRFQSRLSIADDQGSIYKIYAIPGTADIPVWNLEASGVLLGTYTELEMNPVQTEWTEKVIPIPENLAGTLVRIAMVMQGDDGDRWFIDNFTVTNSCYAPKHLHATNITNTTATLGWTDQTGATTWEVQVLPADATVLAESGVVVNENSYVVDSLIEGAYKFYVRSVCGPEHMSAWTGPYYFATDITYNNKLHGIVEYDGNNDGVCDGAVVPNASVAVSVNGVYAYTVYTNALGEYTIYGIPDGTTTLSFQVASTMDFPEIPVLEQQVTFDEEINELTVSHCLPALNLGNNMSVYIMPIVNPVPGFNAQYKLYMANLGGVDNSDVNVTVTFDSERFDYISSSLPATVAGNTLTINAGDFNVGVHKSVILKFHVKEPPVNIGGEIVVVTAAFSEIPDDEYLYNNSDEISSMITNSFDPNDITVHEGAKITEEQADDYLTYTIRFQNEGNGNAINIRLENTLDELLDWDTFEMIGASHPGYNITRTGNELEFFFPNIQLPFKDADEPGSHGYVTYRIKPKGEYGLGDIISNQAGIYFDFNAAVMTNVATTEVIEITAGLSNNALSIARLYPNPVKDQLHVEVGQGELKSVAVYDINGRLCLSTNANVIDANVLNSGIYFVKVTTDIGSANYKIIKH